jgi:hypothetical protein
VCSNLDVTFDVLVLERFLYIVLDVSPDSIDGFIVVLHEEFNIKATVTEDYALHDRVDSVNCDYSIDLLKQSMADSIRDAGPFDVLRLRRFDVISNFRKCPDTLVVTLEGQEASVLPPIPGKGYNGIHGFTGFCQVYSFRIS